MEAAERQHEDRHVQPSFQQRTLSALAIAVPGLPLVVVGGCCCLHRLEPGTLHGPPPPCVRPLTPRYLTPSHISVTGMGAGAAAVMSSTDSGLLSATSAFSSNIKNKNVLRRPDSMFLGIRHEMLWVIGVTVVGLVETSILFYTSSPLVL